MKRGKKIDSPSSKPQKTIIDFFRRQSTEPAPPVLKITCPACFVEVPEKKINWHLDQDCKSRERRKKKKDENLAKRKKILKSVKNEIANKKKKKLMLSDDEENDLYMSDESDVRIIEKEDLDDNEPYITSSMVETHIFEIDDEHCKTPGKLQRSSSLDADQDTVSPYSSQSAENVVESPEEHKEIKLESEIIDSPQHRIASLQADWESPCLSPPGKGNTPSNVEKQAGEGVLKEDSNTSSLTPSKLSLNKKKSELVVDTGLGGVEDFTSSSTYQGTPLKHSKSSSKSHNSLFKASIEGKEKCEIVSGISSGSYITSGCRFDGDSDDDFEKPIQFRTPEKFTKKRLKNISESCKKNKTSGVVSSSVPSKVSLSPVSGPADVIEAFPASLLSSRLVSLERLPRPTINSSESKEEHIRRLFPTSTSESSQGSICKSEASSCKVFLSQDVNSSANRFPKIDKESVFDALLNTASQSQNSDISLSQGSSHTSSQSQDQTNQDEGKKRVWVRTPRKINQSIKSTGILQSSPQNISKSFVARRRSFSLSPQKQRSSPNKQIGNSQSSPTVSEIFAGNKYDKSHFRGHKGYYLENFLLIMTTVLSEPGDLQLFNEEDLSIVKSFHKLSLQAQKLYVRLFQRKLKWNRVSKLDYRDICDQEDMELYVKELSYANFLRLEVELSDPNEVLQLLSANEVKDLCKQIKIPASGKKEDLIKSLLYFDKSQPSVLSAFSKSSANCVILKQAKELLGQSCLVNKDIHRVFMRIIMLYGLPKYDDEDDKGSNTQLTTLLMVNLGKLDFPKYDVVRQHSIFQSRDELIRFEGCSQILSDLHDCLERQQWEESLQHCELAKVRYEELSNNKQLMEHDLSLPTFLRCYTSFSVLVHIISCSVECYQRLKNYRKAVEQLRFLLNQTSYLQDYRGRWYDRLALNLEVYLKSPLETLEVIKEALIDPEVREGHRLSLSMRAERMAASSRSKFLAPDILELPLMKPREAPKVIIEGRSLPGEAGYKKVFIRQDSDRHAGEGQVTVCSVEELVLNHYKDLGYSEGLHHEGSTVNSIFGLLFWDILYSSVPDVFRSPHQAAPLDLNDQHFYAARKKLIEDRLSQLEGYTEKEAGAALERIWNEHTGKVSIIAWNIFRNLEHVKGLVSSLKLPVVASICRRLALDHRFTRSGFPDLIVWNPVDKKSCVVEVKGPNDRLSTKQILWLDYLLEHDAVAEVCHVEAIGAKKMKLASPRRISPKKRSPVKVSSVEGETKNKPGMRKQRKKNAKVANEQEEQNSKSVQSSGINEDEEVENFQFTRKKQKEIKHEKVEVGSKSPKNPSVQEGSLISRRKLTNDIKNEEGSKVKKSVTVIDENMLKPSKHLNNASREKEDLKTEDEVSIKQQKGYKNTKDIQNISKTSRKRKKDADTEHECSKPPEKQARYNSKEQLEMKGGRKQARKTCLDKTEGLKSTKKTKISQTNEEDRKSVRVTINVENKAKKPATEMEKIVGNLRQSSRRK